MKLNGLGYDFYDDYGNLVHEEEDGTLTLIPPSDTDYYVTPDAIISIPTTPADTTGRPTVTQAAAIAAANPASSSVVDWLKALAEAVPKALQLYNAQQIAAVNVKRAQSGLAPLNAGLYGPQVGVGMNADTQRMMIYGALGIGALLLLSKKR